MDFQECTHTTSQQYTVVVVTFNEEDRIALTLRNFQGRAPLIVVDNFSSDATSSIAEGLGARVIKYRNPGFATRELYEFILGTVETEWFLLVYCGHYFPLPLLEGCEQAIASGNFDAVALDGYPIQYGRPTYVYGLNRRRLMVTSRLAKKNLIDLSRWQIHSELVYSGDPRRVWYPPIEEGYLIQNFRHDDFQVMHEKTGTYSREEARQRFERGERSSASNLLKVPFINLAKCLLWRGGLREGWRGILTSIAQSYQLFAVQAQLIELCEKQEQSEQRLENMRTREGLLNKFHDK